MSGRCRAARLAAFCPGNKTLRCLGLEAVSSPSCQVSPLDYFHCTGVICCKVPPPKNLDVHRFFSYLLLFAFRGEIRRCFWFHHVSRHPCSSLLAFSVCLFLRTHLRSRCRCAVDLWCFVTFPSLPCAFFLIPNTMLF